MLTDFIKKTIFTNLRDKITQVNKKNVCKNTTILPQYNIDFIFQKVGLGYYFYLHANITICMYL